MSKIKLLQRDILSNQRFRLEDIKFEKQTADGSVRKLDKEVYFRGDAISILPVDYTKRCVLLTRQFRMPVFMHGFGDEYLIEACAGIIDEGETPEETVKREGMEETHYEVFNITKVAEVFTSPGSITELLHLFLVEYKSDAEHAKMGGLEEEGEEIELLEISFDEVESLFLSGQIKDAKTMILLQHFLMNKSR